MGALRTGQPSLGQIHALAFKAEGKQWIAGVDEVGRGPLAGPVLAAAVLLPETPEDLAHVATLARDSKRLSARQREKAAAVISRVCLVGFGMVAVDEIDRLNIRQAALRAMAEAVVALPVQVDAVLVDGRDAIPGVLVPQRAIIKGDALELSVACASIMAKVRRDAMMRELDEVYPLYGWRTNAGYGSAAHLKALHTFGVTPHHRRSFAPVRHVIQADSGHG